MNSGPDQTDRSRRGRHKIFLHIGLHKTGTTSIQWALRQSRKNLEERDWLYPKTGCPDWAPFGQHFLPWSIIERPGFLPTFDGKRQTFDPISRQKLWEDLHQEIHASSAERVILSSEEFDVLNEKEIKNVGELLTDYAIVPIIYLRNYAEFIESSYRTAVLHSGNVREIGAYAKLQRTRLDYAQLIRDWSSIASGGDTVVMNYDDPGIRENSVNAFSQIIGLGSEILMPGATRVLNESLPAFVCELARFLRLKGCPEAQVQKWIANMRQVPFSPGANKAYSVMPADLRHDLENRYAAEVAAINADPNLRSLVRGGLLATPVPAEAITIRHQVDAILVLGREMAARQTPGGLPDLQ